MSNEKPKTIYELRDHLDAKVNAAIRIIAIATKGNTTQAKELIERVAFQAKGETDKTQTATDGIRDILFTTRQLHRT